MNLIQAVRALRRHTGETQQIFSTRLGLSTRALANYEATRPPKGKALASLCSAADEAGRPDLARIFFNALKHDLALTPENDFGRLEFFRGEQGRTTGILILHLPTDAEQKYALLFGRAMQALNSPAEGIRAKAIRVLDALQAAMAAEFAYRLEGEK